MSGRGIEQVREAGRRNKSRLFWKTDSEQKKYLNSLSRQSSETRPNSCMIKDRIALHSILLPLLIVPWIVWVSWKIYSVIKCILTLGTAMHQRGKERWSSILGKHDWTEMLGWVVNFRWVGLTSWGLTIASSGWGYQNDIQVANWCWGVGGEKWSSHLTCATFAC